MKPQTAAFLEKANALLVKSDTMLRVSLTEDAGRTAYMAAFHAAQALIFEVQQRVFKTHSGVQAEFARLVKNDLLMDNELRSFLGMAYKLKAIADYESGPDAIVTAESARAALHTARRFVDSVTQRVINPAPPVV